MDTIREEAEKSQSRKPGAKPSSVPFTAPENQLLSERYLAYKSQYHSKSRIVVGEKNGETSQEKFACQFATELTKLGFAHRTPAQVKQRIADIRKLGHKLIIKESEQSVDNKKRKKVFVEGWLRNVMDALVEELQETESQTGTHPSARKRTHPEVDTINDMTNMVQMLVNSHRQTQGDKTKKKKKTLPIDNSRPSPSFTETSETSTASSCASDENPAREDPEAPSYSFLNCPIDLVADSSQLRLERNMAVSQVQEKLLEVQLRVALKTEKLLDLKIKKMEFEMALAAEARLQQSVVEAADESEDGPEEDGQTGATAEIEEKEIIESLLRLKEETPES